MRNFTSVDFVPKWPEGPELLGPRNDTYLWVGPGDGTDLGDPGEVPKPNFPDTSLIPYPDQLIRRVPTWEMATKIAFYSLVMMVAVLGNLAVIVVVWRNKRMWTTTNFYIVNLAVSDLMVTLSCTWVHLVDDLTEGWVLGAFFCKFNSFAQVLSLISSILTLTLIACDRFFGIVFAMKAHLTERRARTFIIIIWVCSIGISAPLLFFRKQFTRTWANHVEIWCADVWPVIAQVNSATNMTIVTSPAKTFYYTFISLVLYFFPIVIMSFAYTFIIWKLWSNRLPGEHINSEVSMQVKRKRKVIVMLLVILSSFAFCWLPYQISILYSEHREERHLQLPEWYSKFSFFAVFIAYANSALNPVIYTCFNASFRRGFEDTFGCKSLRNRYCAVELRRSQFETSLTVVSRIKDP